VEFTPLLTVPRMPPEKISSRWGAGLGVLFIV